jgi:hypothetical protein
MKKKQLLLSLACLMNIYAAYAECPVCPGTVSCFMREEAPETPVRSECMGGSCGVATLNEDDTEQSEAPMQTPVFVEQTTAGSFKCGTCPTNEQLKAAEAALALEEEDDTLSPVVLDEEVTTEEQESEEIAPTPSIMVGEPMPALPEEQPMPLPKPAILLGEVEVEEDGDDIDDEEESEIVAPATDVTIMPVAPTITESMIVVDDADAEDSE